MRVFICELHLKINMYSLLEYVLANKQHHCIFCNMKQWQEHSFYSHNRNLCINNTKTLCGKCLPFQLQNKTTHTHTKKKQDEKITTSFSVLQMGKWFNLAKNRPFIDKMAYFFLFFLFFFSSVYMCLFSFRIVC